MIKKAFTIILVSFLFFLLSPVQVLAEYSILINKSTNQLTLYDDNDIVRVLPVATGRKPGYTPEGVFRIVNKLVNPYYGKKNIPGGSPRNPLGPRWLGLSVGGGSEYGIHGNNDPSSIGKYVSAGCIRMKNDDVIWLFERVSVGTVVKITSSPQKKENPAAPEKYTLSVNGKNIENSRGRDPFISGGTLYIPVRAAVEGMGYPSDWLEEESRYDIRVNRCTISLSPGSSTVQTPSGAVNVTPGPLEREGVMYAPAEFFRDILESSVTVRGNEVQITSREMVLAQLGYIIPGKTSSAIP
ncbi:MAG: L,D-transpeptidase family protein [Bacillota bacterium]